MLDRVRRRHRPDHPQAVPQAGRADRLRRVPLLRLDPRRRDRAGAEPDPGHRSQLRLRLLARARPLGAGGLRLRGDRRPLLRRHLLLNCTKIGLLPVDPRRGALQGGRRSRRGADRRRRPDRQPARAASSSSRSSHEVKYRLLNGLDDIGITLENASAIDDFESSGRAERGPGHDRALMTGSGVHTGPRDWDAETYDAVSDPQFEWGKEVLERLDLQGDEAVLDAGCGSGRVTAELLERLPEGRLVAVDGSEAMIAKARERLGDDASYLVADLTELQLAEPVDAVVSTATFHWVLDHDLLFRRLRAALRPRWAPGRPMRRRGQYRGVLRGSRSGRRDPSTALHRRFRDAWNFAGPEETEREASATPASPRRGAGWSRSPSTPEQPSSSRSPSVLGPQLATAPRGVAQALRRGGARAGRRAADARLRPPQHRCRRLTHRVPHR